MTAVFNVFCISAEQQELTSNSRPEVKALVGIVNSQTLIHVCVCVCEERERERERRYMYDCVSEGV